MIFRYEPSVHSANSRNNCATRLESPGADLNGKEVHQTKPTSIIPSTYTGDEDKNVTHMSEMKPAIRDPGTIAGYFD